MEPDNPSSSTSGQDKSQAHKSDPSSEPVRSPRKSMPYHLDQEFSKEEEFAEWLHNVNGYLGWKLRALKTNIRGEEVRYYTCSRWRVPCPHKLRTITNTLNKTVRIETTLIGDHNDFHEPTTALTAQMKTKIDEYYALDLKPAAIHCRLSHEVSTNSNTIFPSLKQIQEYVKRLKKKEHGCPTKTATQQ